MHDVVTAQQLSALQIEDVRAEGYAHCGIYLNSGGGTGRHRCLKEE
jgi:hypothetical protein